MADPWVTMAAVAQSTARMRLGMLVTPRPDDAPGYWPGRRPPLTGSHGAGSSWEWAWGTTVPVSSARSGVRRQTRCNEGPCWTSRSSCCCAFGREMMCAWEGQHFAVGSWPFLPRPVQDPLPVWVACRWPHRRPLARAAQHQGCFPLFDPGGWDIPAFPDPGAVLAARTQLRTYGAAADIDIICRGASVEVETGERAERLAALEAAGMTWWLESFGPEEPQLRALEDAARKGPPGRQWPS